MYNLFSFEKETFHYPPITSFDVLSQKKKTLYKLHKPSNATLATISELNPVIEMSGYKFPPYTLASHCIEHQL